MSSRIITQRSRAGIALALAGVLGLSLGIAGTASYALWRDSAEMSGSISSGYEYFAAGLLGDVEAPDQATDPFSVTVPSGWEAAAAATLLSEHSVAVVFETQSLSQGNKGLSYDLVEPSSWGDGVFGDATVNLYWVDSPEQCAVGVPRPSDPDWVRGYESSPVSSDYSTSTTVVTEYWCLLAQITPPEIIGKYDNTATVTGRDPLGEELTDTDRWYVDLEKVYDAAAEGAHPISFTYYTYRPEIVVDDGGASSGEGANAHE